MVRMSGVNLTSQKYYGSYWRSRHNSHNNGHLSRPRVVLPLYSLDHEIPDRWGIATRGKRIVSEDIGRGTGLLYTTIPYLNSIKLLKVLNPSKTILGSRSLLPYLSILILPLIHLILFISWILLYTEYHPRVIYHFRVGEGSVFLERTTNNLRVLEVKLWVRKTGPIV